MLVRCKTVYYSASSQGVAVLGIALIAMGEEIGSEMALRTFGHLVSSSAAHCQFTLTEYLIVPHLTASHFSFF